MATRTARNITKQEDIDYIINTKEEDMTLSFFMETFGEFNGKSRFNPYDEITIPKGAYGSHGKSNTESFKTTVGIFIFNRFFIEKDLIDVLGYINKEITPGVCDDINQALSYALLEDKIEREVFVRYLQKSQFMMPLTSILSPNYTEKMLTCTKVINKKKEELLKKYEKEIDAGDPIVGTKIEKELLDFAIDYMKGDPSMDMFMSGASGNLGNNFKNMFVMKGIIKDPDPNAKQKYHLASSNYIDGMKAEEYPLFANSLAAGPFSRAKKTEVGGALEKLFLYGYQHIKMDDIGSDCGTKRYITVDLTKKNVSLWMYSFIIDRGKLVELTSDNMDKYIGTTVKVRFSSLCEDKKQGCICNMCMGNLPVRRGVTNVGIETTQIASTLKNASMKAFHDSVQKMTKVNVDDVFCSE